MRLALGFSVALMFGAFLHAGSAMAELSEFNEPEVIEPGLEGSGTNDSGMNGFEASSSYDANQVAPGTAAANAADEFEDDSEFSNWMEENGGVVSKPGEPDVAKDHATPEQSDPTETTASTGHETDQMAGSSGEAPESHSESAHEESVPVMPMNHAVELGKVGYDDTGRPGRVHEVVNGDTLWDISDAYLGTPWVWPSIWTDNQGIDNPHLINPGDHIWITPDEMRRITPEQAEQFLAGEPSFESFDEEVPAAFDETAQSAAPVNRGSYRFSANHTQGFVSAEEFTGSATIVDATTEKVWLAQPDRVLIGWGAGETQVGDQYQIFRPGRRLVDTDTNQVIGYTTEMLGWLEVNEVHAETATATIRLSRDGVRRGDHLIPRTTAETEIAVQGRPNVDGQIIHMPDHRSQVGNGDVVYLDRGASHGLTTGSPVEIYRPMEGVYDSLRESERAIPDNVVAKLIVVGTRDETSIAVVTHAETEVETGDYFRGSDSLR